MRTIQVAETTDQLVASVMDARILDNARIKQLGNELDELIETCPDRSLVLDLGRVQFMSSAMISKLVHVNKAATAKGIKLVLVNVQPNVAEVFKITKLENGFHFDEA